MNFKDMLDKLSMLSEATKETEKGRVHKADVGGYGRKYDTDEEGDEKDGDKDAKKPTEKRGRGRPAKTGAHVSSPAEKKKQQEKEKASKDLQSFIVGNVPKKPSKELKNLPSKKHSLKEFFDQIDSERMIKEAEQITMEPANQNTQVIKKGTETLGTVSNPNLASQIKQAIGRGEMNLAGAKLGEEALDEKWAGDAKIKATGEYSKKSVEELKSMLAKLKKSGPHDADSPEAKKQRQINFALRSKGGWKKGEGAAMKEENLSEVEQPTMDNMSAMGAGLGAGRSNNSLEEAKKTVKRDDKAEKAGRKVAKDIEYDEKVKDKIHGTKRHSEDEKAERAGKKVAKDIEYDEKKAKKKHVKEGMSHNISAARLEGKAHGLKGHAYRGKHYEDMEEARAYHEGYVEGLDECYGMEPIRGVVVGEEVPATVSGMANQAERMAMEADLDEMNKTEYMKQKARTTPGNTFKAFGQTMHDKDVLESPFAFESLDKQLNELLIEGEVVEEGMSVSISKGNQGAPDSVTVSAQDHEAEKLLSFIKQAGLGLFGDEQKSDYGSPAGEISKQSHGDIEVVDDHDGMMSLMKKMAGMEHGSDDGDYRDEEHHDDHDHEQEGPCNECGYMESDCQCDEEMVEDESYDQEEEIAAESDELAELKRLAGHNTAQPEIASREGMQEDNPPDSGAEEEEEEIQDTAQANATATDKQVTFGTTMEDGSEASEEPVQPMTDEELDEEKDKLDEWANEAGKRGTDAAFLTDDEFMIDTITSGLNKRKATGQATIPVIASQGARDGNEDIGAWKKLAGLTK